jgi:hypothetical protein
MLNKEYMKAGGMAQAVKHLYSNLEALSSNPRTEKKKTKKNHMNTFKQKI